MVETGKRELKHLLRPFESYALPRMARSLPGWVMPDHLTAVGFLSALGIGICYALTNRSSAYLWAANVLWVVNWFGDSLDGTLARVRHTERPRYGYYLDHVTDMFSAGFVCVGLGFSPYLLLSVALAILIAYYLLSINVYLESQVLGVFDFGYNLIGPTELRVILILAGTALALGFEPVINLRGVPIGPIDVLGLLGVLIMIAMLVRRIVTNLAHLGRLEPANVVKHPERADR